MISPMTASMWRTHHITHRCVAGHLAFILDCDRSRTGIFPSWISRFWQMTFEGQVSLPAHWQEMYSIWAYELMKWSEHALSLPTISGPYKLITARLSVELMSETKHANHMQFYLSPSIAKMWRQAVGTYARNRVFSARALWEENVDHEAIKVEV